MAGRPSDINQRIVLLGADQVRKYLDDIGKAGADAGDKTRKAFGDASRPLNTFTAGTRGAAVASGQMRFALQNLSFQLNDVATSLASGGDLLRVFAQQGGQVFQIFQQAGPGLGAAIRAAITPMRALAGVGAAAAGGVGVLGARAISADNAVRQFKVTLDALKPPAFARGGGVLKGLGISPEDLEAAAKRLRAVGLSLSDARKEILETIQASVDPKLAEQVVKFGKDLDSAFGEKSAKSAEAFKKAIAGGPAELRKFGESIGQINPGISELQDGLRDIPSLLRQIVNAPNIAGAAQNVLDPVSKKARDINVEFQNILDKMSLFFKEGFVNLAVTGGAALDVFRALGTAVRELNFTGIAEGAAAAFEPLKNAAAAALDAIRARLAMPDPFGITVLATTATANIGQLFATMGQTAMDTLVNAFSSIDPFAPLVARAQSAVASIQSMLQSLLNFAKQVGSAVGGLLSAPGMADIPAPGFAAGGMVRGPGTGTSDSILARLSAGEFVVRSAAVAQPGVLQELQRLNGSLLPRRRGRFASGGLVGAAAAGGTVAAAHFHFGDGTTGTLRGERSVVRALAKEAGAARMLSAGRKPGWHGGRRYGG